MDDPNNQEGTTSPDMLCTPYYIYVDQLQTSGYTPIKKK